MGPVQTKRSRHGAYYYMVTLGLMAFFASVTSSFAALVHVNDPGPQAHQGGFGEDLGFQVFFSLGPVPVILGLIALAFWVIPNSKPSR
jgi:hypothetical protein